ncbi:PDR/VanB family oxidoreductase [Pseudaquabacterium rugosum]|uniref:PDR/VanB family oxidoreductase n=1 Tax=Pseudaquabacterium rugosum TaxID=2984194 RepID=A0ABU9BFU0_9BURK
MTSPLLDVVVRQRQIQGAAVAVLELERADGAPLPAWSAGAHIDLHLGPDLVRAYSLCGDPTRTGAYRLGVLKDAASRGGSQAVHARLLPGTALRISAPRNHFPLAEEATHHVLIGGGIGITPMIAMAWALHAAGRPFALHYAVRGTAQAAFLAELATAPWADRVRVHADDGPAAQKLDALAVLRAAPAGRHVYVCGPAGFMDAVLAQAREAGLAPAELHREYFQAPAQPVPAGGDRAFELVARRSGKTVTVAADETPLAALARIGIRVPVSCQEGVCGTCACEVIDGTPEHRDAFLTDEERAANDQILVCCSRSAGPRLVLDL